MIKSQKIEFKGYSNSMQRNYYSIRFYNEFDKTKFVMNFNLRLIGPYIQAEPDLYDPLVINVNFVNHSEKYVLLLIHQFAI
ncbi:hypothetical protein COL21_13065 [Bacillus thuringiensis]|uniref:hypothetical protein n=1 Tax=Bacillus thuringiensis TaxID=1428 RepID=UPI000BF806E9|nr:hypothetical protein [Bacillus thuringiensis]PFV97081.1 hypothetical protein COL21_13065 [Bacillus thuringiensis]PGR97734.1 hypothetical protein COC68_12610 [Bacillus thuringiensis]